jgi:hypothetical protein
VTGIVPLEAVLDLGSVEFDHHRAAVRTGVGVLTVVQRG